MTDNSPANTGDKLNVLVVDDSRVMRKAINKILQDDAIIIDAEHGEDGWKKIVENKHIQVLITDIEMPILDGYQLICRIRASEDPRIKNLPVITITGAEDEETKARAFACGATDFIIKPLDKVQLQARVQAHAKADDVSRQLQQTTATLEEEATTDPLTGLASRRYFLQRIEQDTAHAKRHQQELTLMRADVDNFKKLYQTHGEDIADQVLIYISRMLQATARTEDTVARIGGAEFSIIAPSTSKEEANILAQRMLEMADKQPFNAGDADVPLTLSIGVATLTSDDLESAETLLETADNRLRNARAEGGNTVSASARSEAVAEETVEVTLDAPTSEDIMAEAPIGNIGLRDGGELSVEEAEAMIRYEAESLAVEAARRNATRVKGAPALPENLPVELININQVLDMLANDDADKLNPYLIDLAIRVIPLLEHCDKRHQLGLGSAIDSIKESIFSFKS